MSDAHWSRQSSRRNSFHPFESASFLRLFLCQSFLLIASLSLPGQSQSQKPQCLRKADARQMCDVVLALGISFVCFRSDAVFLWIPAAVALYVVRFVPMSRSPQFVIGFGMLSQLHLNYIRPEAPSSALRYASTQAWLRLLGFMLSLRDGRFGSAETAIQKALAVSGRPSTLDIVAYCLCPQLILAGPIIPFRHMGHDREDTQLATQFPSRSVDDRRTHGDNTRPDAVGLRRQIVAVDPAQADHIRNAVVASVFYLTSYFVASVTLAAALDAIREHVGDIRMLGLIVCCNLHKLFWIAHWKLAEAVCISAGHGYCSARQHGARRTSNTVSYDVVAVNVRVWEFATSAWFDESSSNWDTSQRFLDDLILPRSGLELSPLTDAASASDPNDDMKQLRLLVRSAFLLSAVDSCIFGNFISRSSAYVFAWAARRVREFRPVGPRLHNTLLKQRHVLLMIAYLTTRILWVITLAPVHLPTLWYASKGLRVPPVVGLCSGLATSLISVLIALVLIRVTRPRGSAALSCISKDYTSQRTKFQVHFERPTEEYSMLAHIEGRYFEHIIIRRPVLAPDQARLQRDIEAAEVLDRMLAGGGARERALQRNQLIDAHTTSDIREHVVYRRNQSSPLKTPRTRPGTLRSDSFGRQMKFERQMETSKTTRMPCSLPAAIPRTVRGLERSRGFFTNSTRDQQIRLNLFVRRPF